MPVIVILKKEPPKEHKLFLKGCHFVMGDSIVWMLACFERFCALSKKCSFATFPKI